MQKIYKIAGDCALKGGHHLHAVEYYGKSCMYDDMLDIMVDFIAGRMVISKAQAEYFFEKLRELPPKVREENYLAKYIESCLHIQMLQTEKAFKILKSMEQELLGKQGRKEQAMLGEVYERMAGVYMMQSKECFMEYYKKAYEYIPKGSVYKKKSMLRYKNYSIFSLQDYGPGALKRMEKVIHDGFEYMNAVENGTSPGFQYLYSSEASYYTYDLANSQRMAHKALFEAEAAQAHDIACNALLMLAKAAYMQGKYSELVEYIRRVEEYVDKIQLPEMNDVKEYASHMLDFLVGPVPSAPKWIRTANSDISVMAPLAIGREELHYPVYLLQKKKYSEMVAYLELIKPMYMTKGWGDSLTSNIMLAVGYLKLHDEERAIDTFKETYDLTYHNRIITPFIEQAGLMRTLIEHVRHSSKYCFDGEWLNNIYRKASTHAKRLSFMNREHMKQNNLKPGNIIQLSERETEVLQSLAQGLTCEEIAEEHHIAVSTVKSVITNIYSKLGAVNRADAVRIAIDSDILS
jgi:LuxR family maltose regulon positive regulatory protein